MGHYNTNANKAATDRQVIRHVAGNEAIAANDLVCIGERSKIWPVKSKPFATVSKVGTDIALSIIQNHDKLRDGLVGPNVAAYYDKDTLATFVALINTRHTGSHSGIYVNKYNSKGENVKQLAVTGDTSSSKGTQIFLKELSDGNLLVVYNLSTTSYFRIINKNLDIIVAETSLGIIGLMDVIALSGGGFAIFGGTGNTTLRTFNNNGTVLVLPVVLTTASTHLGAIELSNGNIGICLANTTNTSEARVGVINVSGAFVSPLSDITTMGRTVILPVNPSLRISMSSINGFFCCECELDTRISAAVYTDAGQLRNYSNTFQYGVTNIPIGTTEHKNSVLVNDGTSFWILCGVVDSSLTLSEKGVSFNVIYIPTTGLNTDNKLFPFNYATTFNIPDYTSTNTSLIADGLGGSSADGFYSRGVIVFSWLNTVILLEVGQGTIDSLKSLEHDPEGSSLPVLSQKHKIINLGDGAYFWVGPFNGGIKKYVDYTIVGVSKINVAAGNENAPVDFIIGSGVFTINPIPGDVSSFDYSADTNTVTSSLNPVTGLIDQTSYMTKSSGKSGTIFNNSVLFNK